MIFTNGMAYNLVCINREREEKYDFEKIFDNQQSPIKCLPFSRLERLFCKMGHAINTITLNVWGNLRHNSLKYDFDKQNCLT